METQEGLLQANPEQQVLVKMLCGCGLLGFPSVFLSPQRPRCDTSTPPVAHSTLLHADAPLHPVTTCWHPLGTAWPHRLSGQSPIWALPFDWDVGALYPCLCFSEVITFTSLISLFSFPFLTADSCAFYSLRYENYLGSLPSFTGPPWPTCSKTQSLLIDRGWCRKLDTWTWQGSVVLISPPLYPEWEFFIHAFLKLYHTPSFVKIPFFWLSTEDTSSFLVKQMMV